MVGLLTLVVAVQLNLAPVITCNQLLISFNHSVVCQVEHGTQIFLPGCTTNHRWSLGTNS